MHAAASTNRAAASIILDTFRCLGNLRFNCLGLSNMQVSARFLRALETLGIRDLWGFSWLSVAVEQSLPRSKTLCSWEAMLHRNNRFQQFCDEP